MPDLDSRLKLREWQDPVWRLHNLYWGVDERGRRFKFKPNAQQTRFLENLWFRNVVLKSRQHGFTTLAALMALDRAVWSKDKTCGFIAHGLREAEQIFRTKIKFPYDHLPEGVKEIVYPTKDSASELALNNGSQVYVGTSMRSGTVQFLHVSEFGKICARFPLRATEVMTGALNAAHEGAIVIVESTAEGQSGAFYDLCQQSQNMLIQKAKLSPLDFKFHFFGWWEDPKNTTDPANVVIPDSLARYFDELGALGIKLSRAQKAWYAVIARTQNDNMKREHPSTPAEAFQASTEGAIFGKQMMWLRAHGRIRSVPAVLNQPVNTFWDLGRTDYTAIWFHQYIAGEHRFVRYYQNHLEDLAHYVRELQKLPYLWGRHYVPHDAENRNLERNESRIDRLVELGIRRDTIKTVERVKDKMLGIDAARTMLPLCWFDHEHCADGVKCLDGYEFEWDEKNGRWRDYPKKNWAGHGADAFQQFAQDWQPMNQQHLPPPVPGYGVLDPVAGY